VSFIAGAPHLRTAELRRAESPSLRDRPKRAQDQPIALITGASGGIGSEIALSLAQRGYGCVLLGRDEDRLAALEDQLRSQSLSPPEHICVDLAARGSVQTLMSEMRKRQMEIGILVNCAGCAVHGEFVEADRNALMEMLQVNILALTELTRMVLPGMIARGSGYILNMASVAAYMPGPLLAAYFASKAYVLSFSEALAQELGGTGVSVTAVCPGPTRTQFARRAGLQETPAFRGRLMSPAAVAEAALDAMFQGKRVLVPDLSLRLQMIPARLLPRRLLAIIARRYHTLPEK